MWSEDTVRPRRAVSRLGELSTASVLELCCIFVDSRVLCTGGEECTYPSVSSEASVSLTQSVGTLAPATQMVCRSRGGENDRFSFRRPTRARCSSWGT